MPQVTRRRLIQSATATSMLLTAPPLIRTASARTRKITIASLFGEDKPETKIWQKIAELVEQRLPQRFSFNIVKNSALGGEKDVAEGIILGSIQASLATASALSSWVPALQILDLPFLFRSADHVKATVDGNLGIELRAKLAARGIIAPAFINYGARQLLSKERVTQPEQLRGLKIRVVQSPMHAKLWSAFDATPVGIPITETYNALSTGVVDTMDLTKSAYAGFKLYEVVPHLLETNHIWASGLVYYANSFWSGLSEEERQVFHLASIEGAAYFDQLLVEDEKSSMREAKAKGCIVTVPDDYAQWRRVAEEIWQDYADLAGGMSIIKEIESG